MPEHEKRPRNLWMPATIALAAILAVLIIGWIIWCSIEKRALFQEIQSLRDKGEPVWLTDFHSPDAPDDQNAAVEIRLAAKDLDRQDAEEWKAFDLLDSPELPLTPEETKTIRTLVQESQARFAHLAAATTRPAVDWQLQLHSPAILILSPHLNQARALATLAAADVLLEHEAHNEQLALERIDQILFLARATDQQTTLVAHLVSIGLSALAADRCIQIAPDLQIATAGNAARPQQVRRLIAEFLDDRTYRQGQHDALVFERASEIDAVLSLLNGNFNGSNGKPMPVTSAGGLMRPAFLADARLMARHVTGLIQTVDTCNDLPAARRAEPVEPPEVAANPNMHLLAGLLLPSLGRALETHYRGQTDRHLAATAFAIRCYAIEHNGKLPEKLNDLVPHYLPALPSDPLAGHQPLKYLPRPNRPVIYSVGIDGKDQGASTRPINKFPHRDRWDSEDAVVNLIRQPRVIDANEQP